MDVLVVDDHALFREGLKFLLRELDGSLGIDEAPDCAAALARVAARRYDLVLLDLNLPGLRGMDALAALLGAVPGTPTVVLSGEDDPQLVRSAIKAGAMGFIPKSSTHEVLIQALRLVFAGGVYLPPAALDTHTAAAPAAGAATLGLTPRQMDVLRCVIQGKPNKSIARDLDISEGTVKAHLSAVMQALNARNRTEAVYAAAKLGLRLP
jgi:DNA-binding NarL/FixJ family response regulator